MELNSSMGNNITHCNTAINFPTDTAHSFPTTAEEEKNLVACAQISCTTQISARRQPPLNPEILGRPIVQRRWNIEFARQRIADLSRQLRVRARKREREREREREAWLPAIFSPAPCSVLKLLCVTTRGPSHCTSSRKARTCACDLYVCNMDEREYVCVFVQVGGYARRGNWSEEVSLRLFSLEFRYMSAIRSLLEIELFSRGGRGVWSRVIMLSGLWLCDRLEFWKFF